MDLKDSPLLSTGSPESFAKTLCQDMGVGGEFAPLVAHSIREQAYRLQRERLEAMFEYKASNQGKSSSSEVATPPWLQQPAMVTALRKFDEIELWGPSVEILSQEDLERRSLTQERALRRLTPLQRRPASKNC